MPTFREYQCQQCGACLRIHSLVDEFNICKYCNTVYQAGKDGNIKKYDTKKASQEIDFIVSSFETQKYIEITKEIEFLKKQYENTQHESIPIKIKRLEEKISSSTTKRRK